MAWRVATRLCLGRGVWIWGWVQAVTLRLKCHLMSNVGHYKTASSCHNKKKQRKRERTLSWLLNGFAYHYIFFPHFVNGNFWIWEPGPVHISAHQVKTLAFPLNSDSVWSVLWTRSGSHVEEAKLYKWKYHSGNQSCLASRFECDQCCQVGNVVLSYQRHKIIVFWGKLSYTRQNQNNKSIDAL